jgi:hypothetical protein
MMMMLMLANLVIAALPGSTPDPEPAVLVGQLGAPRFAIREAAARALEEQGTLALAALRAARDDKDAEVRSRATALVEKIESGMMVKPTMVRLDFDNAPLGEVVKSLSAQSRMQLTLQPENNALWSLKRITLKSEQPVAFWEAVDRLCQTAGLQTSPVIAMPGQGGKPAGLSFSAGTGWSLGPTYDSGPFRLQLISLHHHKDVMLGQAGQPGLNIGQPPRFVAPRPALEELYFQLQVMAEPRLMVSQSGALTITEALDEKGNSLLPPASPGNAPPRYPALNGFGVSYGALSFQLRGQLKRPDSPGSVIKTLKGKIPVTVSARKEAPLEIPLTDFKDKVVRNGDVGLTILEVGFDEPTQRTTIDLAVRNLSGDRADGSLLRNLSLPQNQFEIVDAKDRIFHQVYPATQSVNAVESRIRLVVMMTEGLGRPTKVRYYDLVRATTEAVFEFHDQPLP